MGGYECADHLNAAGNRVDLLADTQHIDVLAQDYTNLLPFGISTVREGIRWSVVETAPYRYDFSVVKSMIEVGRSIGIQQIWDLCHFGFPSDLSPLHPHFTPRFEALCRAFAEFYRSCGYPEPLIVTPINEVSFLSWLGGEARGTSPYCTGQGWEVKYGLMRAFIRGTAAILEVDPRTRILTTEPLTSIVPPLEATPEQVMQAKKEHDLQFQSLDMLSGHICPELGGKPEYLDILGFNFYYNNQWVLGMGEFLPWAKKDADSRWRPLSSLLADAYTRYKRPIALTETSHCGIDRPKWVRFVAEECALVVRDGVPFWGICLYPIIDRPDWDNLAYWHGSGLWDARIEEGTVHRQLDLPYARALHESRAVIRNASEFRDLPRIIRLLYTAVSRLGRLFTTIK